MTPSPASPSGGAPSPQPSSPWTRDYLAGQLRRAVLTPIKAMRREYVPLLMVYFAYGCMALIAVAQTFWVKAALTLTPAELAALAVWLNIPWTIKMVFGELVDAVPVLGSQRRGYVLIGGGLITAGLLIMAGAASGRLAVASPNVLYVAAALLTVLGLVVQDVVADAMSTEVVERVAADGSPRPQADIDRDLGMVQVLGRLAIALGAFATAGLGGWLASKLSYATVFLLGLIVPVLSISGAMLVRLETPEARAIDWRILGGGLAFGAFVVALGVGQVPFGAEIVFLVSMGVVCWMLTRVAGGIDPQMQRRILFAAILIFLYRAAPNAGQGYSWFTIDKLGFDETFQGVLAQVGTLIGLVAVWLFSDAITRQPIARVLLWLTIAGAVVSLPGLALTLGVHEWTERVFGFGARSIGLVDAAAASPLLNLGMIPMLTLIAIHAPAGHRATWFALMASLMNLALSAGDLTTKYLNLILHVDRGQYANLPLLYTIVLLIGLAVPLWAILRFGAEVQAPLPDAPIPAHENSGRG